MNRLVFILLLALAACANSRPAEKSEKEAFEQGAQRVGQTLAFRSTPVYYARPDSTSRPATIYDSEPFTIRKIYVASRKGRWYQVELSNYRTYYILVSSMCCEKSK